MRLDKLLQRVEVIATNTNLEEIEINDVKISSKDVEDGDVFVCLEGVRDDGNTHLNEIKVNFIAITELIPSDKSIKFVKVANARLAYARICQNYFLNPANDMKFVSIVGTNGKTSTAHYISSMLSFAGMKVGLMGTEGHYILGEKVSQSLTTPDPYELNQILFKMRAKGVEVVVMEVSAHAIYLEKLGDIKADIAILTNITQDHLDYFDNFDNYCGVKMSYFDNSHIKSALINVDDVSGRLLNERLSLTNIPTLTYGLYNPADCFAINVREDIDGIEFVANVLDDIISVRCSLFGEFNVYNLLSALSACKMLGIDVKILAHAVRKIKAVKGRFTLLKCEKGGIIIDYAHTPDGLANLLSTARTLTKSRLITVFGCGGERDKSKRRAMGEVASKYSDFIVLTSDNPRGENPLDIIRDIEWGVSIKDVKCIVDRMEAVRFSLQEMEEGDTLVIAGKGNENYLEVKGKKIPYNDFDVVARYGQLK